jgi:acyl-CoA thioester hydrolase
MTELLDGFPVTVEIPVAWAEMDFFRHVNNTVYFRWFETARIAYLERIGFAGQLLDEGLGPILASTSARFRRPVFYPDTITVGVRTTDVTEDRFTNVYRAVSGGEEQVVAEGEAVVVSYDYGTRRKTAIPEQVRGAIRALS